MHDIEFATTSRRLQLPSPGAAGRKMDAKTHPKQTFALFQFECPSTVSGTVPSCESADFGEFLIGNQLRRRLTSLLVKKSKDHQGNHKPNSTWTPSCLSPCQPVAGRESGSPELLESPRTSPGLPRKFPSDFPRSSLTVELNSNPEVPQTSPEVSRTSPEVSPFVWET